MGYSNITGRLENDWRHYFMGGIVIFACSLSTGWTKLVNFGTM